MKFLVQCVKTFLMATIGAVAIAVPIAILAFVIAVIDGMDPDSSAGSNPGTVKSVFELQAGECFDVDPLALPAVASAACSAPHDMEVFALIDLEAMQLTPGPVVREVCLQIFPEFAGIDLESSVLEVGAWVPSDADYAAGFRISPCYVRHSDGIKLTGSMARAGI